MTHKQTQRKLKRFEFLQGRIGKYLDEQQKIMDEVIELRVHQKAPSKKAQPVLATRETDRTAYLVKDPKGRQITPEPVNKSNVLRVVLEQLAPKRTLEQLQAEWKGVAKMSSYGAVLSLSDYAKVPESLRGKRYREMEVRSRDDKKIFVLVNWALFTSHKTRKPGNFHFLKEALTEKGYELTEV